MEHDLRIISLNIARGMLADDLLIYIQSKAETTSVFCFQEISESIRTRIDAILEKEFASFFATKTTDRPDTYYEQGTYIRRTLTVEETTLSLKDTIDAGLAITQTIQNASGQKFSITNIHGQPRPGHKLDTPERILQSEGIIESMQRSAGLNILLGDFNLLPDAKSITLIEEQGYNNLISLHNIPTTRNEVAWKNYPEHMKQLYADYAFIEDHPSITHTFNVEDVTVSDHLPLQLTVHATPTSAPTNRLYSETTAALVE